MGLSTSPNWPVVVVEADFSAGPPNQPGNNRVNLEQTSGLAVQQLSTQRGSQYELGHAEAGTMNLSVSDPNEALNPINTSSPLNSNGNTLLPYRAIQAVAWWNATAGNSTTGNILNSTNNVSGSATAFDPSFESGTSGWTNNGTAATVAQSTAQAFNGTHSLAVTVTASTDNAIVGINTLAGYQQTLSLYVYVPTGATVTASHLNYPALTTIASASSTTTGAWQRLTMTGTPTSSATIIKVSASGTYSLTFYLDAVQLELAATASAFTTTGPTRNTVYTGFVERYPSTWVDAGFRAVRPLVAVDSLSVLSRTVINQSYQSTILADSPVLYMPYNDKAFPQKVQLPQGGQPFIPYTSLGNNKGSVNVGGGTFLDGSSAAKVTQQNVSPVVNADTSYITYLGTRNSQIMMNTQAFTIECWAKFNAGTVYFGAGSTQTGDTPNTDATGLPKGIWWYTTGGSLAANFNDPNGSGHAIYGISGWNGFPDSTWHYLVIQLNATTNNFLTRADNIWGSGNTTGTLTSTISLDNFYIDATTYYGDPVSDVEVANLAVYPSALSTTQLSNHYNRGIGFLGELPGSRAARILNQYWSTTLYRKNNGYVGLAPDYSYNGRTVLDCLNEIADTEGGRVFADKSGIVVFESRATRSYTNTSAATFGENAGSGEIPYESLEYDFDPTYVFSQANLTRPGNNNYPPQVNTTSQNNYGQRILSQTLQVNTDYDLSQAANFYLTRYATPKMRIRKLTVNPATNPAAFGKVLGLDISSRVTVNRRTSAGTVISGDYYVEQINHNIDASARSWTVDLQLSPVFVPKSFILGDSTYGVLGTSAGNAVIY